MAGPRAVPAAFLALLLAACSGVDRPGVPATGAEKQEARRLLQAGAIPRQRQLDEAAQHASLARVVRHIRPAAHRVCQRMRGANCNAILTLSPIRSRDRQINAHVDGSHRVTMNAGLLAAAGSDEEIAAVLAHEYGHVIADHIDKRMEDASVGALSGLVGGALIGAVICNRSQDDCMGDMVRTGGSLGLGMGALAYSQQHELEADYYSALILAEAGVPLEAGERMLMRLARTKEGREGGYGPLGMAMARTHPANDERIARWIANRRALQYALSTGLSTDAALASEARRRALETGAAETRWANPGTGHSGVISVKKRWRSGTGEACVRYGWKSWQAAGRAETGGEETACRQAGGPWRVR
ncbi:MAG: M48 family metalloprotease [Alphaproteobacteria bacterium]|nr:M48 family metalloprotease [Alphaproteobacteria bacterium]